MFSFIFRNLANFFLIYFTNLDALELRHTVERSMAFTWPSLCITSLGEELWHQRLASAAQILGASHGFVGRFVETKGTSERK